MRIAAFIAVIGLSLLAAGTTSAQDPMDVMADSVPSSMDEWGLAFTPYAMLAANNTTVGGEAIRQSFSDLASITNGGFQGRVFLRFRKLAFTTDFTWADLGINEELGPIKADVGIEQWIVDLKLNARVYDTRTPERDSGIGVWAGIGARYWRNDVLIELTSDPVLPGTPGLDESDRIFQKWWDPVFGGVAEFPVTPSVGFLIKGTLGGFGIADASDYIWDLEFDANFRLSRRFLISAGYRHFKYKRVEGSGEDEVDTTVSVLGPQIGLSIGLF